MNVSVLPKTGLTEPRLHQPGGVHGVASPVPIALALHTCYALNKEMKVDGNQDTNYHQEVLFEDATGAEQSRCP